MQSDVLIQKHSVMTGYTMRVRSSFLFYFRMDEDQCARRNLQLFFGIRDPDYYEFEGMFVQSELYIYLVNYNVHLTNKIFFFFIISIDTNFLTYRFILMKSLIAVQNIFGYGSKQ